MRKYSHQLELKPKTIPVIILELAWQLKKLKRCVQYLLYSAFTQPYSAYSIIKQTSQCEVLTQSYGVSKLKLWSFINMELWSFINSKLWSFIKL